MYIGTPHICLVPAEVRKQGILGTKITDDCEPPCGCLEENPDPLQEQQVLLTSEPSL